MRHAELLPALASLIIVAAERSQMIVVTHSEQLVAALEKTTEAHTVCLTKEFGETRIVGQRPLEVPAWHWPPR